MTTQDEQVIAKTRKWITDVVIGCNFCPFAAREVNRNTVRYVVENSMDVETCLQTFIEECLFLDDEPDVATTLIIYPNAFRLFYEYLDFTDLAERLLKKHEYEGVYQVASFHPEYRFADSATDDPADYTNRSVYPMLHLLREESIAEAVAHHPDADGIPARNVQFAREKGLAYMKQLRDACM